MLDRMFHRRQPKGPDNRIDNIQKNVCVKSGVKYHGPVDFGESH